MARKSKKQMDDEMRSRILTTSLSYRDEAKDAKHDRMQTNKENFDAFNLNYDWSHKRPGQSTEVLPRVAMSVEQIASFIQQGLIDLGKWFGIASRPGIPEEILTIRPSDLENILEIQLDRAHFYTFINDVVKLGLLGSLMIAKVGGEMVVKPRYKAKKKRGSLKEQLVKVNQKVWSLKIDAIRQEDYFPDPTGGGLYEMQRIEMDVHELRMLAEQSKLYDMDVVEEVIAQHNLAAEDEKAKRARETDQNTTVGSLRKKAVIYECYGSIVDPQTGELLHENVMWTISEDGQYLLQEPEPNPFWHGQSPFVTSPIVRVPNSVWHRALMDAPTQLNHAINEYYNLILDGGLMSVWGIKQLRKQWMEDDAQGDNGFAPGDTIEINESAPVGAKVLENVGTSTVPNDALNVFNATNSEFLQASLTNDLRMGTLPPRSVKATEVVEASNSINSVFNAVAKNIEKDFITPIIEKSMLTVAQNANDLDSDEVIGALGIERAREVSKLSPQQRFAEIAGGFKFQVTGISAILSKSRDFRKFTSLLQTIGSSDVLVQEFAKKYDFTKLMGEIVKSLDINLDTIKLDEALQNELAGAKGGLDAAQQNAPVQPGQNAVNNVPSAATLGEVLGQGVPREEFARGDQQIKGERG